MKRLALFSCVLCCLFIGTFAPVALAQGPIIGEVRMYAGTDTTPPWGWLFCDSTPYSSTIYPELYDVIGDTYGDGYGVGTEADFNVPDFYGYFPAGSRPGFSCMGYFCPDSGDTGGEAEHTLTVSEMPAHDHDVLSAYSPYDSGYVYVRDSSSGSRGALGSGNLFSPGYIAESGGDQPHNNLPPYLAIAFIIAYTDTITATITPTPTPSPTATPSYITGTLPYLSAYTKTLTSGHDLVVPVYVSFGDILIVGTGFLLIAAFGLTIITRTAGDD